jgi:hypothetical protein
MAVDLRELTLVTTDLDAAARFYEAIGLALFCVDVPDHPRCYDGERDLRLCPASSRCTVSYIQFEFEVDDLPIVGQRLAVAGASWTCRLANFVSTFDPEGKITLTQRR